MRKTTEDLGGVKRVTYASFQDERGRLLKLYRRELFADLLPQIAECYLSTSGRNVVRGLHYQAGAKAQDKFIYCVTGRLLDVSVDLRRGAGFGKVQVHELTGGGESALFIPGSFAHGVIVLEEGTTFLNATPQPYSPGDEGGIRWDSLGIEFGLVEPVVSEKDKRWPTLAQVVQEWK